MAGYGTASASRDFLVPRCGCLEPRDRAVHFGMDLRGFPYGLARACVGTIRPLAMSGTPLGLRPKWEITAFVVLAVGVVFFPILLAVVVWLYFP
jgi:hypothetical protein